MSFCKHASHTLWLYSLRRVFQPLRKSGLCFSAEAAEKQLERASWNSNLMTSHPFQGLCHNPQGKQAVYVHVWLLCASTCVFMQVCVHLWIDSRVSTCTQSCIVAHVYSPLCAHFTSLCSCMHNCTFVNLCTIYGRCLCAWWCISLYICVHVCAYMLGCRLWVHECAYVYKLGPLPTLAWGLPPLYPPHKPHSTRQPETLWCLVCHAISEEALP